MIDEHLTFGASTEVDLAQETDKIKVVKAQNEDDIRASAQIARQHFGDMAYTPEDRLAFFRKVPDADYVLKYEGVVVGYFSMQPIKIEALTDHVLKASQGVHAEDIIPFTFEQPLECYVTGMGVNLDVHAKKPNKAYGMLLMMGLFNVLIELGMQGVDIRKIWTKSRTVSDIKLCRDVGFTELGYLDSEHILFKLDLELADFAPIVRYREALKEARRSTLAK